MAQYSFKYKSYPEIEVRLKELGATLPYSENTAVLGTACENGPFSLKNRLGIGSMEGLDGLPDGAPGELTRERYLGYAKGGAGLIWFEAVSIAAEGRSSLKQLMLDKNTLPAYQRLIDEMKEAALKKNGYAPFLVMQANHSGRYSRPNPDVIPEPIIAYHHPVLEKARPVDSSRVATDSYLESLEERFGEAAELSKRAGFDAIDIKSCHGYLLAELASAYTREGKYGGSFENRFRLMLNAVRNANRARTDSFFVTARVNIFDNFAYPYGFGVRQDGSLTPDYGEPAKLLGILHDELGIPFVSLTMGNAHFFPHITRPFAADTFDAPEDPLVGVARMFSGCAEIKKAVPGLLTSASAPSYMRQFAPNLAAGAIEAGVCDHVCFGRLSFANPEFPNDILSTGKLESSRSCLTCGKCSNLLRGGKQAGCVVRHPDPYLKFHRELNI